MKLAIAMALSTLAVPARVGSQSADAPSALPSVELPAALDRVLRNCERA